MLLQVENFRPERIAVSITAEGRTQKLTLDKGAGTLRLALAAPERRKQTFVIDADFWRPGRELGNGDPRVLAFHIKSGNFE